MHQPTKYSTWMMSFTCQTFILNIVSDKVWWEQKSSYSNGSSNNNNNNNRQSANQLTHTAPQNTIRNIGRKRLYHITARCSYMCSKLPILRAMDLNFRIICTSLFKSVVSTSCCYAVTIFLFPLSIVVAFFAHFILPVCLCACMPFFWQGMERTNNSIAYTTKLRSILYWNNKSWDFIAEITIIIIIC